MLNIDGKMLAESANTATNLTGAVNTTLTDGSKVLDPVVAQVKVGTLNTVDSMINTVGAVGAELEGASTADMIAAAVVTATAMLLMVAMVMAGIRARAVVGMIRLAGLVAGLGIIGTAFIAVVLISLRSVTLAHCPICSQIGNS